ncbi:MAG: GH116 family glycosyl-hydrolase, partial [Victivallaceae bacterium]
MQNKQQASKVYVGENCDLIAYPMGGIGAGMICLKGCGGLSNVSLLHHHDNNNEPYAYAAIHIKGSGKTRVLEGPVSQRIIMQKPGSRLGLWGGTFGLPRYAEAAFSAKFPFGNIELKHPDMPLDVKLTGWSPFIPNDTKNSSLPVAAVEYTFTNNSLDEQTAIFSFNIMNFLCSNGHAKENGRVRRSTCGIVMESFKLLDESGTVKQPPGNFAVSINLPGVKANPSWFRGGWFDQRTMAWNDIAAGICTENNEFNDDHQYSSQGGSVFYEFCLEPGKSITVPLQFAWHMPESELKSIHGVEGEERKKYDC